METSTENKCACCSDKTGDKISETAPQYKPAPGYSPPGDDGKRYTYDDLQKLYEQDETGMARYELIDGVLTVMQSPSRKHQKISVELLAQLHTFLKGKTCEVYHAPFDVCLNLNGIKDTVLQPDLIVVCDHSKFTDKYVNGASDLVVEILSPSTAQRDRLVKLKQYEKYGVREFWIIEPDTELLTVYILNNNGKYNLDVYDKTSTVPVHVLEGCVINMEEVFGE